MINGELILRNKYPDLDEAQYQPNGIDLTLDKVAVLKYNEGTIYGLLKDAKILPEQEDLETKSVMVAGMIKNVFVLEPNSHYIATTKEKIKISEDAGQIYFPRSSALRGAIDVRTAWGDAGFHGHLSFLLVNNTDYQFVLEKGVRFAQLVDIQAEGVTNEYNGDYTE